MVDIVEPESIGDRGIDFHGFACDTAPFLCPHRFQRTHVVQPVRQFNKYDAHVPRHGQQHFAEILRLCIRMGLELDLVELRNAVHQIRNRFAKSITDLGFGDMRILHHIVQ